MMPLAFPSEAATPLQVLDLGRRESLEDGDVRPRAHAA